MVETKQSTTVSYPKARLESELGNENNALLVEKNVKVFNVTYATNEKTNHTEVACKKLFRQETSTLRFPLIRVTVSELRKEKRLKTPLFVLKVDSSLYMCKIPPEISFMGFSIIGTHKCAITGKECRKLCAPPEEGGSCEKVMDGSKDIERYPWITLGFEVINTKQPSFRVVTCTHYEACPPRKQYSKEERDARRLAFAQNYFPHAKSLREVKTLIRENKSKGRFN